MESISDLNEMVFEDQQLPLAEKGGLSAWVIALLFKEAHLGTFLTQRSMFLRPNSST